MKVLEIITVAILPIFGIFETNLTATGDVVLTGGYESEFLKLLLKGLKRPYRLVIPKDLSWGIELENGSVTGLLGMVTRNEADMAMGSLFLNERRAKAIYYTYPYTAAEVTFATRYPADIHSAATLVYPFTVNLWTCILFILFTLPLLFKLIIYKNLSLESLLFDVLAPMVGQSMQLRVYAFTSRLLVLSWLLAAFLISQHYCSVLLSFVSVPLKEQSVKDIHSLSKAVDEGKMKAFMPEGSSIHRHMLEHSDAFYRMLAENILKNKWFLKSDPKLIRDIILNGKSAFFETRSHLKGLFGDDAFISEDILHTFPVAIVVKKNFALKKRINNLIHRITVSGIYEKNVRDDRFYTLYKWKAARNDHELVQKITLDKLRGAFLLLIIGLALALIINLIEIFHYKIALYFKKR